MSFVCRSNNKNEQINKTKQNKQNNNNNTNKIYVSLSSLHSKSLAADLPVNYLAAGLPTFYSKTTNSNMMFCQW